MERPQEFRMLCLTLKGQRLRKLAAEFGEDGSLTLHRLLPSEPHVFVDLTDGATDTKWASAHIFTATAPPPLPSVFPSSGKVWFP